MYSVRAGPGGGRSVFQGGRTPHHPGTHLTPGPSLPAPAEGVPGEAPEGPKDQPTQVGWVLPCAPTLPASVFPGSREGAGAQKTIRGRLVACGESSEWGREWEGLEVGMTLRDMWTPSLPGIHKFSFLLRKTGTVTSQERGCAVAHIAVLSRLVCGEPFCPCLLGLAALGKPIPPFVICPVFRECD